MTVAVTWPINEVAIKKLEAKHEVKLNKKEDNLTPDELKEFVKGADAILCLLTNKIDASVLDAAGPQLKVVASMSVGFDHIDLKACAERSVIVTNTPSVLDNAVAEHAIALMFGLSKALPAADRFVRAGKYEGWDPKLFVGPELTGKTLGIVGVGHIGSKVAHIAKKGLAMNILYTDIKRNEDLEDDYDAKYRELDDLLAESDVVSIHVPLLPTTKHLINLMRLKHMKETAFLINTSRGPVVDEAALVHALKEKIIAGAGIDVFEHEPKITPELLRLDNVIMTPHTASATKESRDAMANDAAENVLRVLAGKSPLHEVKAK